MIFKNIKGFSLPEITVALGLVAGVSLVTMKLVESNAKNQSSLASSAEIQKTVALLKQALSSSEGCRYILRNQTVGSNGTPVNITTNPQNAALGAGLFQKNARTNELVVLLKPNTTYQGFKTTSIQLQRPVGGFSDSAELIIQTTVAPPLRPLPKVAQSLQQTVLLQRPVPRPSLAVAQLLAPQEVRLA
jgi:hypothetical protein